MDISHLESFAADLKAKFNLHGPASPEDQLKPLVADLVKAAGADFNRTVESLTETHLSEFKVRPDMAIYVKKLVCGHIELKAPGLGADAPKLKGGHNKKQWEKLKNLPNLIYTDGQEWALYRHGKREGEIVRLKGDPSETGKSAVTKDAAKDLSGLLRNFLGWNPVVPHKPDGLAKYLAPLARFLRSEVEAALLVEDSNITALKNEWRNYFFPEADDAQFADAYAQTVTYAMLLARLSGAEKLDPQIAAKSLKAGNNLLARVLELLGQEGAKEDLRVGFELLQRSLEALDPHEFLKSKPDLWLYFYEDFLAAYDPKLRKDYGVYYTPREVVELQVRLASELLEKRFGKKLGFADDGVVFLDPAVGTGTYLVAAVKHALEKVRERSGEGAVAGRAAQMAENMHGFEVLIGAYSVAHLRLTQTLEGSGAEIKDRLKVYLADTLASPHLRPPGVLDLTHKILIQEHESARKIKNEGDVLVCLGNPPYDRQHIEEGDEETKRKGGWVRFGDRAEGGAKQSMQQKRPIFEDFTELASKAGQGVHIKNLYNDYVYFWRWALWRMFEQQNCGGVITFITASSYLTGPGFVGMREMMRRAFDDLWVLDLGGDSYGARKTPNVFSIQTPVAIAIGVRGKKPSPNKPANVHYATIKAGTRDAKLEKISNCESISKIKWEICEDKWQAPFMPSGKGEFFEWPKLPQLLPWSHSGVELKRSWPIGETKDVLKKRWKHLLAAKEEEKDTLIRRTSGKNKDRPATSLLSGEKLKPIRDLSIDEMPESFSRYSFRPFDRRFIILDARVGDRFRPPLLRSRSKKQVYFGTLQSGALGHGPAMVCVPHIPDRHLFSGGGKDIFPLYRDAKASEPNITNGMLDALSNAYGKPIEAKSFAAYVYCVLGGLSYINRFWDELENSGPRLPITKDYDAFRKAAILGRRLIWLHTYAERFQGKNRGDSISPGKAKSTKAIPAHAGSYPDDYGYDEETKTIWVGAGEFGPVSPKVWDFKVSGFRVVQSWLGYRMKNRKGKKSSPLDDIRPKTWTPHMTDEFLELLWVMEATLKMEPDLSAALDEVLEGDCFTADELPHPTEDEQKPPKTGAASGGLL